MAALIVSPALVRDWLERARTALASERLAIDALNVFPVPDGDTGTNLFLTVDAALEAVPVDGANTSTAQAATAAATGALLGARGNSGVIFAQMLRGVAQVLGGLADRSELGVDDVRAMLRRASDLGYQAVSRPVEGTILTVARAAADAVDHLPDGSGDRSVVEAVVVAADGARDALARTTEQLEALRRAGVVDAGGRGFVVVLDALAGLARGDLPPAPPPDAADVDVIDDAAVRPGGAGPAYEVMFLLEAPPTAVDALRVELDRLGESLMVVGSGELWHVHVHVDDAGAAIEAAMSVGRPHRIRVTYLEPVRFGQGRTIVAVAHGAGIADLLLSCDVVVVRAVAGLRPATGELLEAILRSRAAEVIVLPSDGDTTLVAEQAALQARAEGLRVSVIPTRAVVQTLAAVAVHDPAASFDEDVVAMTRAAGATRYAAVTVASRAALTTVGPCAPGDVLGLVDGDIVAIGVDLADVARELLSGMLAVGGELVTLVPGEDADQALRAGLREWLEVRFPLVEVVEHDGGQPLWPLIVGVE